MRSALAVLLCATGAAAQEQQAQERESVEHQLIRLVSDLRFPDRANAAVAALVKLGAASVPALAAALEVLPSDTLDNQAWKEAVLVALERLGPLAREAGPEVLIAAFTLPVSLSEQAFTTLGAVGPAAHVRCALRPVRGGEGRLVVDGISIPGPADAATVAKLVALVRQTSVRLRNAARELDGTRTFLMPVYMNHAEPTAEQLVLWAPLWRDMTRQALVACLMLPGLNQESDALTAARALVRFKAGDEVAEHAHALLLLKGTAAEQFAAASALGHRRTHSRHVVRALRSALYHADPRVVCEAITGLGLAGAVAAPALADLKELSAHQDVQIAARASAAVRTLSR